jgi:outer membrane protein assembly factor BamB/tRNA A-37 threonylcarbamoyl transferase component Bud32
MGDTANESTARDDRLHAIIAAYLEAVRAGRAPDRQGLLARHPDLAEELTGFFADHDRLRQLAAPDAASGAAGPANTPTSAPGPAAPADSPAKTSRSFGDYELLEEVARGGMGVVYKGRQIKLNRIVAVKMILAGELAGEADVRRFHAEAQTAANLQHPNIVAIHEVGKHEGQHYFSMDYVEGVSLADLVREQPLAPARAARYVKTIADAIHYAHQHGVLHRDLKPSNVLIDRFDQPRITDFGLAKWIDRDACLTATGAVVGTPSYMPPEQAEGKHAALGPAADVYSLGAVLYELVTGRPPFQAATPLDTLMQVLHAEPAPPWLLNPSLPRDLETVILKCLRKEPGRRYATAQELADDLAAFLEGRPVRARRPSPVERAVRWARKQRRSAVLAGATAAASVLLVVAALVAWGWYREATLGHLVLTTEVPFLQAEVLDPDGQAVRQFFVPHPVFGGQQEPVDVPAGDYRLRLLAPGQLSEDLEFRVAHLPRPQSQWTKVRLDARALWEPVAVPQSFEVIDLEGRSDVILTTGPGVRRLDGRTGKPVWDVTLTERDEPDQPRTFSEVGGTALFPSQWPRLVRLAPDLDGDGTGDLVWASRVSSTLVALSGKTGKVLWWHYSKARVSPEAEVWLKGAGQSRVVGEPVVADVPGQPAPCLIATYALGLAGAESMKWVEAVSGRTGEPLWRYEAEGREGSGEGLLPAQRARPGDRSLILVPSGSRLVGLDLPTGKPVWERDLGVRPVRAPQIADLDGHGRYGALVLQRIPPMDLGLTAVALDTGRPLWEARLHADWPWDPPFPGDSGPPDWPLVADLGGDRRPAVIVADRQASRWGGVRVLDGLTGAERWHRGMLAYLSPGRMINGGQIDRVVVGSDLDGDGCRDLFVASRVDTDGAFMGMYLCVDALSGKDGHVLWSWRQPQSGPFGWIDALCLWRPGADGWPQLVVPYRVNNPGTQGKVYVLAAGTGRLAHVVPGLVRPRIADFDGDGLSDLYGILPGTPERIQALRGMPPDAWRRPGVWNVAPDFDGDGAQDLLSATFGGNPPDLAGGKVSAVSGRDGHVLWQADTPGEWRMASAPPPHGDLDGDGTADLVIFTVSDWPAVRAVSGKTGKALWTVDDFHPRPGAAPSAEGYQFMDLQCHDLDGDGVPEVLMLYLSQRDRVSRLWLVVLSGRDGRLKWRQPLGEDPRWGSTTGLLSSRLGIAPLRDPRVVDVVVWGYTPEQTPEVRAFDGRDGTPLWQRPVPAMMGPAPVWLLGDLDGDGRAEVVVVSHSVDASQLQVLALNGADGRPKWTWQRPETSWPALEGRVALADLDGNGRRLVCLAISQKPDPVAHRVVLLDGQVRERASLPLFADSLRNFDPDGSGKEALLLVGNGRVYASRGKPGQFLWTWPIPGGQGEVVGIEPAGPGRPAVVAVRAGNTVHGLGGTTGVLAWRCEGPGAAVALLPGGEPGQPPDVLFQVLQESTVCRQALRTATPGLPLVLGAPQTAPLAELPWATYALADRSDWMPPRYLPPTGVPAAYGPPGDDPRLARPLPWFTAEFTDFTRLAAPTAVAVTACLGLLIVPALLIARAARRRAWRSALTAALYVGACLALLGLSSVRSLSFGVIGAERGWRAVAEGLFVALVGLPIVAFAWYAFRSARRRDWRRLGALLALSVALTLLIAAVMLWVDARRLEPSQHYSPRGWYTAWFLGAYAAGVVLVLGIVLAGIGRLLWRGPRRVFAARR